MHQRRGHDRRPSRRTASKQQQPLTLPLTLDGTNVVLIGYFSAKVKDYAAIMDSAAAELTLRGAQIIERFVQRRGVSDGGVEKMDLPFSSRTLLSPGKVSEIAAACQTADLVVLIASPTGHQQRNLTAMLGCPVLSLTEVLAAN